MASERATLTSLLLVLVVFLLGGFGSSDFAQDRAECQDKLVGLATCLPFVGGEDEAKAPTMDCCYGVKEVVEKSKKCVCILIKDRNDPSLGLKINVTLAAHLPSACHAPANLSDCVNLLHLAPNSPEAKEFERLQKLVEKESRSASVSSGNSTTGGTVSSSDIKNDGGWGKRLVVAELVCGISPILLFISHMLFLF